MMKFKAFGARGDGILVVSTIGNKYHVVGKARRHGFPITGGYISTPQGTIYVVTIPEIRTGRLKGLIGLHWWFAEERMKDEHDIVELTTDLDMTLRQR